MNTTKVSFIENRRSAILEEIEFHKCHDDLHITIEGIDEIRIYNSELQLKGTYSQENDRQLCCKSEENYESYFLQKGDSLYIPAGTPHSSLNFNCDKVSKVVVKFKIK